MSETQTAPAQEQKKPELTFAQYKQRLKNDHEIMKLRCEIAEYTFKELAALNQYNQLRAMLSAQMEGEGTDSTEIPAEVQESENETMQAVIEPDMVVETP